MNFEWDEQKRRSNIAKHGIDFGTAVRVFEDPRCVIGPSTVTTTEKREVAIGRIGERCIAVVFVRREQALRLISARAARRKERSTYEQG